MKRILGVDYGDVRVGLAISDELGITAQGLDTFVINGSIKKLISHIINLTKTYDVQTIVFGYPKNMNGTMSEKTKKVDEIISLLKEKLDVNIVKWDERLTTVSAYRTMRELNISQKEKNTYADKLAATYILEGYLNSL
jgi:RNAse H domain protein, YqgF family